MGKKSRSQSLPNVASLEKQLLQVQRSTKTLFRWALPLHEWLRIKSKAYYQWHLKWYADSIHWGIAGVSLVLTIVILVTSIFSYPERILASTFTKTWNSEADFNTNAVTSQGATTQTNLDGGHGSADTSYSYLRQITIRNSTASTLTNFQVKITLDSNNFNFARTLSSGNDIRFYDIDDTTSLSFFTEKWDNAGSSGIVWVKVPSIAASSAKNIYMYYGKAGAASASSAASTFIRDISGALTSAWSFDETSGTTVADSSGNSNTGNHQGTIAIVDGQSGKARSLSAGTGQITTTNSVSNPQSFTLSAWFKTTTTTGGKIIGFGSSQTGTSSSYDRHIYMQDNGKLTFGIYNGGAQYVNSSSSYNDGAWHQVIASSSGAGMVMYVDGTSVGTNAATGPENHAGYWRIGYDNLSGWTNRPTSDFFTGTLDEVRVYNRVLTSAEITDVSTNIGTVTPNYSGHEVVRKRASSDTSIIAVGAESATTTEGLVSLQQNQVGSFTDTFADSASIDTSVTDVAVSGGQLQLGSGSATDLTSALTTAWGSSQTINDGVKVANGDIYLGTAGGKFGKYVPGSQTFTDLTSSSGLSATVWGTQTINKLAYDATNNVVYLGGASGSRMAKYTIASTTATILPVPSADGNSRVLALGFDSVNTVLYWGNDYGNFGKYTVSGNSMTDLAAKWNGQNVTAMSFDSAGTTLYIGGPNNAFYKYVPATDTATSLSPNVSNNPINSMAFDSANGTIYLAAAYCTYRKYTISSNTTTNISVNACNDNASGIHSLAFDTVNSELYIGGINSAGNIFFVKYATAGGTVTDKLSSISGFWGTGNINRLLFDGSSKIYLLGASTKFATFNLPATSQIAQSTAVDSLSSNITFVRLTKNDTVGTGTLAYTVSNDGGTNFSSVTPGVLFTFSTTGTALKWKVTLTGNATVQDVTLDFGGYATSGTLTNLKVDAGGDAQGVKIDWVTTSLPTNTAVKFRTRGATNAEGAGALSSATWSPFITTSGGAVTGPGGSASPTFRYLEMELTLDSGSTNGAKTPILDSFTLTYAQNVAPNFNANYPTTAAGGATAAQDSTPADADYGKVQVSYSVRDADSTSGTNTPGLVTPSFKYRLTGSDSYTSITSGFLSSGALTTKAVDQVSYTTYSAVWDAKAQLGSTTYTTSAQIEVTVNDSEVVNATATASTAAFTLDTKSPAGTSVQINSNAAETNSRTVTLTLASTDDSSKQMQFSNDGSTFGTTIDANGAITNSGTYETFGTSKSWTLASGADGTRTVTLRVRDAVGNTTTATDTIVFDSTAPGTPGHILIRDISSTTASNYQVTVGWDPIANPPFSNFQDYLVERSTNGGSSYSTAGTVTTRTQGYFVDTGLAASTLYTYRVTARTTPGNTAASSTIQIKPAGGATISSISAGTPGITSATITASTDLATAALVEYGTTTGYGASAGLPTESVTSHSVGIPGLAAGTLYHYRVRARDISGNETTSADQTFTTATDTTAPTISSGPTAGSITDTTVVISWTTNEVADSQVIYGTVSGAYPSSTTLDTNLNTGHSVALPGLSASTTYYFKAKTRDASGNLTTSSEGNFTTATTSVAPIVSSVVAGTPGITSITITWTTNKASNSIVEYGTTTSYGSNAGNTSDNVTSHSVTVTGLTAGTLYHYRVHSRDATSSDGSSVDATFTTATDTTAPTISTAPAASNIADTTATITWTTNEVADSQVIYGTVSGTYPSSTTLDTNLNTSHTVVLTGLTPNTPYFLKAKTKDGSANLTTSSEVSFTTTAVTVAPVISGIATGTPGITSIDIGWSTDRASNSVVEYGTTTSYGASAGQTNDSVTNHSVTLSGLTAETLYHYRIHSRTATSNDGVSGDNIFTTAADTTAPTITGPNVVTLSDTAATITWGTDESADTQVAYGTITATYPSSSTLDTHLNDGHTVVLNDLTPNTMYFFVVKSHDEKGNLVTSDEAAFATSNLTVAPVISDILTNTPTITTATITWSTDKNSSSIVEYGTTNSYGNNAGNPSDSATSHTVTLTNLTAGTLYHYRVHSRTATSTNGISLDKTFTTSTDTTAPTISNLAASDIHDTSAVLTWKTDEVATTRVIYGTGGAFDQTSDIDITYNLSHAIVLTGLEKITEYHFKAISIDSADNVSTSPEQTFTTTGVSGDKGIAPKISAEGPLIKDIQAAQATIEWATDEKADSIVVFGTTADLGFQQGNVDTLTTTHTVTVIGLAPETTYHFIVKSRDGDGNIGESAKQTFTTTTLPIISSLLVSDITLNSAIVSWTTSTVATSIVDYGTTIAYGTKIEDQSAGATTQHTVRLANLDSGVIYHLRVSGIDEHGHTIQLEGFDDTFSTIALPTISDVRVSDITESRVTLAWTTNVPADTSGLFSIDERLSSEQGKNELLSAHLLTVTGLAPDTTYFYQAKSRDVFGNSTVSTIAKFTTTKDTGAPVIADIQSESSTVGSQGASHVQVIISFTTNEAAKIQVEYGSGLGAGDDRIYEQKTKDEEVYNESHLVILPGLNPSTTYHFRVLATDKSTNQSHSEDYTVLTPQSEQSVLRVIVGSLEDVFGFVPKIRDLLFGRSRE